MAAVTDLKNGMWFIHWFADASNAVETVKFGQTSFELQSTIVNSRVNLYLVAIQDGKALSPNARTTWPPLPQKVRVLYNGQMKQMTELSPGQWETDSWSHVKVSTFYDPIGYYSRNRNGYAVFQLTLEFKDTSFADGERQVLTHLSKLLDTQLMADVTFILNNEKIGAHSAIVVSASPVICAMLEKNNFKEGRTKEVKIVDINPVVFKEMLRYLYTGRAPRLDEDGMTDPLFLAADKYQIEALKNFCEQSLIRKLNVKTVLHYLVVAHLYTAPKLLESSLVLMEIHKKEVKACPEWKELMKNYPELFFLAANRMIG